MAKLKDIGEFALIERIRKSTKTGRSVVEGIGDDAAVIKVAKNRYMLFTSDMLIEGVHFTLKTARPSQIGHKALGVNISDIAAMGGTPRYAVVSVGIPPDMDVKFADELYGGIQKLADRFSIDIVGGDTNASDKVIVNVALTGEVRREHLILRKMAKPGDLIFVTGELGSSVKGKHLDFIPRLKEARYLTENFHIRSMIDVSDSLAGDLMKITSSSRAGSVIYEELIPVSDGASIENALYDGEDFELLFTVPGIEAKKLFLSLGSLKVRITQIGEITSRQSGDIIVDKSGKKRPLEDKGFRHF
ncbi:MAG: thiamine-phosphate kinase [Candidatus Omnitrophica bacterium CG1_02_49_10]|nr:MAG: thiamine-phosphate kinase [Candidatus Omnitrophica bacterium CG1_02_49_10]